MVDRVQVVIEVPVKEEEVEEECCEVDTERPPDAAVLHHTSTPTGGGDVRRRKSSAGSHHRTEIARSDSVDEGEEGPSDEASGGGYVDEEGENAGMGTVTARGKTMPWGRRHIFQQPDEEDDELMMYASLKVLPPSYSLDTRVYRSLTRLTDLPRIIPGRSTSRGFRVARASLMSLRSVYQRRTFQRRSAGQRRWA